MSVTVPAGATVTVAGATPLVPVSNSVAIASGPLPTQFIATGLKSANQTIQPAPGTPLTLLQVRLFRVYYMAAQTHEISWQVLRKQTNNQNNQLKVVFELYFFFVSHRVPQPFKHSKLR